MPPNAKVNDQPQNRNLRIRFGLKSTLVLFIVLAVPLSWLANECIRAKRDQKVVDWIESYDTLPSPACEYKCRFDKGSRLKGAADWLGRFVDGKPFYRIEKIEAEFDPQTGPESIQLIGQLDALNVLSLSKCSQLVNLDGLEPLNELKFLSLNGCDKLKNINGVRNSPLESLALVYCRKLDDIEPLRKSGKLNFVRLICPHKLLSLSGLEANKGVTDLHISDAPLLKNVAEIGKLTKLESLYLDYTPIDDITFLKTTPLLEDLFLNSIPTTDDLNGFSRLKSLRKLELQNAKELTDLSGIENLPNLKHLEILGAHKLQNLEPLRDSASLGELTFWNCQGLNTRSVTVLTEVPNLKSLTFYFCDEIQNADCLTRCDHLSKLSFNYCKNLSKDMSVSTGSKAPTQAKGK